MPYDYSDPRRTELDQMLAGLPPRRELAYRMALSGLSEHCRGDARWRRRVEELSDMMADEGVDVAELLVEAARVRQEILAKAMVG